MEVDGHLKQLAMELYTAANIEGEVPDLSEPYYFEANQSYPVIIIDSIGAIHYFLKTEQGELFYDGWDV